MGNNKNTNIKQLAKHLKENPDDSFTKFALALELLKQNEVTKSRVLFESILKNDPDYLGVYYHLGKLYEHTGYPDHAKELYSAGINVASKQDNQRTKRELQEALDVINTERDYDE
ncbi:MAG: hypothetical protein WEA56_07270 [Balneolaceae bacterium]